MESLHLQNVDFLIVPEQVNFEYELSLNTLCRICLDKTTASKVFNIFEGNQPLFTTMMSCASVQITQGDGLPTTICNKCLARLNIAWQFKMQCENSDIKLRQYYANCPNSDQLDVHGVQSFSSDSQESKILLFNEITNQNQLGAYDDNNSNYNSDEQPQKDDNPESDKARTTKKVKHKPKEKKTHQCETCGKIFSRREYLTQHTRIHTGEKPYRCHLCEKRFINSGHLTTHMRTHTGEKPHPCKICPKAFSTRQELNKHTMVHNGERPFVCPTCYKCFGSSSNLYSHLKHHTGEKNFTCEHCGKAFYTKQELKQHMVVHTGVKPYLCQVCNKRFSQVAHLRRHSKVHS